jgi:hypothetical protein
MARPASAGRRTGETFEGGRFDERAFPEGKAAGVRLIQAVEPMSHDWLASRALLALRFGRPYGDARTALPSSRAADGDVPVCDRRGVTRYLLQQWTGETIAEEDREYGSHGSELWATPSSSPRLLEVDEDDVVIIAGVVDGRLLPICGLTVGRTVSREQLVAEGYPDPYDLPSFAVGKPPSPRMNLRHIADRRLSLAIRKANGTPLARRKADPGALDGQGFRYPQWLDEDSARRLLVFLNELWEREDDEGLDDPVRISRGQAPRMTPSERRAVELRAMEVTARLYRREGFEVADVSAREPWDLTATHLDGRGLHIEVKGTTGTGDAVIVTAGERRHAEQAARLGARPVLVVVSGIRLQRGSQPKADGGKVTVRHDPWDVKVHGAWAATVYRYEPLRIRPLAKRPSATKRTGRPRVGRA